MTVFWHLSVGRDAKQLNFENIRILFYEAFMSSKQSYSEVELVYFKKACSETSPEPGERLRMGFEIIIRIKG